MAANSVSAQQSYNRKTEIPRQHGIDQNYLSRGMASVCRAMGSGLRACKALQWIVFPAGPFEHTDAGGGGQELQRSLCGQRAGGLADQ